MALQINWNDSITLVSAPSAYARLLAITIDLLGAYVDVQVGFYVTKAARDAGGSPVGVLHFRPAFASVFASGPVDLGPAIYAFLKTQPLFTGALDV